MKQILIKGIAPLFLITVAVLVGWSGNCHAAGLFTFDDMEKPKPVFTSSNDVITAKLIPRAKSTSVVIRFAVVSGGRLVEVRGVDFQTVDRPEVDVKNFKSAAFEIRIGDVAPGGEAKVAVSSDFFTASTAFYVFNPKLAKPWIIPAVLNQAQPERVRQLQVTVKDGGELDADGAVNGQITLIGGPRDSFWGYALGTLFIRFFGIFIVLSFLMIGMLISGFVFNIYQARKRGAAGNLEAQEQTEATPQVAAACALDASGRTAVATDEEVAAIGVALHLCFQQAARSLAAAEADAAPVNSAWVTQGRQRIMNERFIVFNRSQR